MPTDLLVRYEAASPTISLFITGYHVIRAGRVPAGGHGDWLLPGNPYIRVTLDGGGSRIITRRNHYREMPRATVAGASSFATKLSIDAGASVGIGISPIGWSRLFDVAAEDVADRVVPLGALLGAAHSDRLVALLDSVDLSHPIAPMLDAFFEGAIGPANRDEGLLRDLVGVVIDERVGDIETARSVLRLEPARLRRLSRRHFGFSPKLLLRRSRFLRSLLSVLDDEKKPGYAGISEQYTDVSHFIRDSHAFLGMTPHQFAMLRKPVFTAGLSERSKVLGAAAQGLHAIDPLPAKPVTSLLTGARSY
ncbi:hypothetical protein [Sphingomonas sp. M1-B02]|uniref:hypothetical protein n=1 Tax=Sphingomonas sp. M1-B02 TaxID=3114300 RepID=UPI0022409014|nr:hypothetical protein [Sphingomonas sp. S6-11]UZK66673.1 hypothetical protein OKW87_02205 [Sphingomonas sp. S6-11]